MGAWLSSLLATFYTANMEVAIVGLDNAGKSTLVNCLMGDTAAETIPTIGLNVTSFRKGNVVIKAWDMAGQVAARGEWGRYAKGVDVIIFVLDASDADRLGEARKHLHILLEDVALANTPLLIAANKIDKTPHLAESEIIKGMNLDYIMDQPWIIVPISATRATNIDVMLQWLLKQRKGEASRGADTGSLLTSDYMRPSGGGSGLA